MRKLMLLALAIALSVTAADSPFVGKWKLNVAKSKFHPGPAPKNETVTIDGDKVTVEETDSAGKTVNWSYTASEGKEAAITGLAPNSTVVEKRTAKTIEHTWKIGGKASTGRGVLSKDGKRMTYRISGTTADGKPYNNVEIYEKE